MRIWTGQPAKKAPLPPVLTSPPVDAYFLKV
jgi:hypothetical protein